MHKAARICLLIPVFYVGLPELSVALVNRMGSRLALVLVAWCAGGIVLLALIIIGGTICLLARKWSCWRACSPARA